MNEAKFSLEFSGKSKRVLSGVNKVFCEKLKISSLSSEFDFKTKCSFSRLF